MVKTADGAFEMSVINAKIRLHKQDDYEYPELKTPEGQIILVQNKDTFMVRITSSDHDFKVYGASLYIDGYKLPNKKTWRNSALFRGFKLGEGNYNLFVFSVPEGLEENQYYQEQNKKCGNEDGKDTNYNDIGTIRLVIHPSKQKKKKFFGPKKLKQLANYQPLVRNIDEKLYKHSLTVQQGSKFYVDQKQFTTLEKIEKKSKYEFEVDYDEILAELEVKYMDYYSAVFKGYVSQNNINHLKLIPEKYLLKNENMALMCINCIVNSWEGKYVPVETLRDKFQEYVGISFALLELGPLIDFLWKYNQYFFSDNKSGIKMAEEPYKQFLANGKFIPEEHKLSASTMQKHQKLMQELSNNAPNKDADKDANKDVQVIEVDKQDKQQIEVTNVTTAIIDKPKNKFQKVTIVIED